MTTPFQGAAGVGAGGAEATTDLAGWADDVVETLANGVRGHETASEKVDDAELARLFEELAESRQRVTEQVIRTATDEGMSFETDADGTFAGALHRTWIAIEGAVSGDSAIVETALTGENHARDELEDALGRTVHEPIDAAIRKALEDVEAAIERLEAATT